MSGLRRYDRRGGIFWFLVGVALCYGSVGLRLGTLHRPGAGFMPFVSGVALCLFGLGLVISTSRGRGREEEERGFKLVFQYRKTLVLIAILIAYASLLEYVGFLLTAFLFLFLLFKLSSPGKWAMPVVFALTAALITYIAFAKWLMVQLPKGILEF